MDAFISFCLHSSLYDQYYHCNACTDTDTCMCINIMYYRISDY